jgi:glycerol-3-phosphate acyltransferase PlsY
MVLVADIAKGSIAVLIAQWLALPLLWVFIAGFAAIVGHNWPVFLRFRGGKGAATTIGVLLALVPGEAAISFAIMAIITIITSNIRLAIVLGLAFLPLFIWQHQGWSMLIAYSLALTFFLIIRNFTTLRATIADMENRKRLIFDRDYHFWQARKN